MSFYLIFFISCIYVSILLPKSTIFDTMPFLPFFLFLPYKLPSFKKSLSYFRCLFLSKHVSCLYFLENFYGILGNLSSFVSIYFYHSLYFYLQIYFFFLMFFCKINYKIKCPYSISIN